MKILLSAIVVIVTVGMFYTVLDAYENKLYCDVPEKARWEENVSEDLRGAVETGHEGAQVKLSYNKRRDLLIPEWAVSR